jgi:hypothetical protein
VGLVKMSYLETECPNPPLPDPGWVAVLLAYKKDPQSVRVCFDDTSLEWERGSHNFRLFPVGRNIGNKMMPLGFMIEYRMFWFVEDFCKRFNVDLQKPCVWLDCQPYIPFECVLSSYAGDHIWIFFLWRHGVSAEEMEQARLTGLWPSPRTRNEIVRQYRRRERDMSAMVWACNQLRGHAWSDCAEPVVKRMRNDWT